jgi:Asp/Glu/hydantoin racemase
MRVLVLNANTNKLMTDHAVAAAHKLAPEIEFTGATGRFGSTHIGTRATYAIASHAAVDCYAAQPEKYDAVILACFGDPGLGALRDIADVPVFALAESACSAANEMRQPFSIVTGGQRWVPMLKEYLTGLGLTKYLASIRVIESTGSQVLADPEGNLARLADACRIAASSDGAARIILGGAGLIGIAAQIADRVPVPLMDCLEPAIAAVRKVGSRTMLNGATSPTPKVDPVFTGINPALAYLLARDIAKGTV